MPEIDLPTVAQTLDHTCGAACFESMFRYFRGESPGEMHFAEKLGTLALGYTPPERIVDCARASGFSCELNEGAKFEDLLEPLRLGAVIFVTWWDEDAGHYSLIKKIEEGAVVLMDPWMARAGQDKRLSIEEFVGHWNQRGARWIRVTDQPSV